MKVANIKTDLRKFFHYWIKVSKPLHHLTKREGEVLAELLYFRHIIAEEIKDESLMGQLLIQYSIKKKIEKALNIKTTVLDQTLYYLRKKKVIEDGDIKKAYIPEIKSGDNQFVFAYKFILEGNEGTNKKKTVKKNAKNIK